MSLGEVWVPAPMGGVNIPPFLGTALQIDATAEKVASIVRAPKTGTLNGVEFSLGTVAQAPANGLRVSFQDVDLTAGPPYRPDGTADQYRVLTSGVATGAWLSSGLMTDDGTDVGVKRTVTKGDLLAVVWDFASWLSGDDVIVGGLSINHGFGLANGSVLFIASWGAQLVTASVALVYSDGSYEVPTGVVPVKACNSATFNSGSSPNERGLRFDLGSALPIDGCAVRVQPTGNFQVCLYDADDALVEALSCDANPFYSIGGGMAHVVEFAGTHTLQSGRLTIKPTSGSDVTLYDVDVDAAALWPWAGSATLEYTQGAAGARTDTATKWPWISLFSRSGPTASSGGGRRPRMRVSA